MAFDPATVSAFAFADRDFDPAAGAARLRYALDDEGFEEIVRVPAGDAGDAALDLLHLAAGVSYYKAADPDTIDAGALRVTPALARLGTLLYGEGLAEFRYRNGLDVAKAPTFEVSHTRDAGPDAAEGPALVPVGGGKDSIATIEALREAGVEMTLFSVGDATPIAATAAVSGLPRVVAERTIDRRLLELNEAGALNGHVPVTAIVSAIAALAAATTGHGTVVMSNERSAGEGQLTVDGVEVNHQFSKGPRAEQAFAAVAGVDYFSLLRPFGELAIARYFARQTAYHPVFTSCNAVFRIDERRRSAGWCTDCPKCRFVFLMLAASLGPGELEAIFGRDMLADPGQFDGFAALLGWPEHKPFECVGTVAESAAAARAAAGDPRWASHAVTERLRDEVLSGTPGVEAPPGDHRVPDRYREALDAIGRA